MVAPQEWFHSRPSILTIHSWHFSNWTWVCQFSVAVQWITTYFVAWKIYLLSYSSMGQKFWRGTASFQLTVSQSWYQSCQSDVFSAVSWSLCRVSVLWYFSSLWLWVRVTFCCWRLLAFLAGGLVAKLSLTLGNPMDCSLCPWNFLGKSTGVHCHFLLQGNLPHLGIKPGATAV